MDISNKYSSVEWLSNQSYELFEQYSEGNFDRITLNKLMLKATEQAKAMHEEEIIKFAEDWEKSNLDCKEDLYNETYGDNTP